ncbi:DUF2163 domain-containing protein [Acuticoccus mangrovi]|uniref:DUF2163 domain-containing protein n=1 Tax=Acuticoccus mangrovi TaxID=2796142 RepID=A0A934IM76_9HYPH|nr:DUF2163 domain-containing protein [Acuticoccus mangrovi]MBJ3776402.1 DUF2163 domain-containing protein [Acuticoccus mangrovi]
MRTLPTGMQAHLDTGTTTLAWCWRVVAQDGAVLGFTDHDRDLAFDGTTYRAETGFTGSALTAELGLAVGNLTADGALQADALTEADIIAGKWDDADIKIWLVNWQDVGQRVLMTSGSLGEVERADNAFSAEVRGLAHRWQQKRGRVYGATCDATLGDARCGVDLSASANRGTGTVSGASGMVFEASGLSGFAGAWFARGLLTFTSGAATGRGFKVVAFSAGATATVVLQESPVHPIAVGDTFAVTAGCDKRFETCRTKFANGINFRGFPHMPGDGYAVLYPDSEAENTGTSRYGQF